MTKIYLMALFLLIKCNKFSKNQKKVQKIKESIGGRKYRVLQTIGGKEYSRLETRLLKVIGER